MRNLDYLAQEMSELCSILQFGGHFVFKKTSKFVLTVHRTSMRNLDSVAQEVSELCSILRFGDHFVFGGLLFFKKKFKICSDCQ